MFGNGPQTAIVESHVLGNALNVCCVVDRSPPGVAAISTAAVYTSNVSLLSEREKKLLLLLGGLPLKIAAAEMAISVSTAETYKRRIAEKLRIEPHRVHVFAAILSSVTAGKPYNVL